MAGSWKRMLLDLFARPKVVQDEQPRDPWPGPQDQAHYVTVPDMSSAELLEELDSIAQFTTLDPRLQHWDFMQGVRGKRFLVRQRPFPAQTLLVPVWRWSRSMEFDGNPGAFLSWLMLCLPNAGSYASISSEACQNYRDPESGILNALCYSARPGTRQPLRALELVATGSATPRDLSLLFFHDCRSA